MDIIKESYEIKETIIKHRRALHQIPEIGMDLPKTTSYVKSELKKLRYDPVEIINSGIVTTIGNGDGKVIMLRADMGALPMKEQTQMFTLHLLTKTCTLVDMTRIQQ